ncbi:hypothetical protein TRFO_22989 [Tritrichomonas foetus]|uniref:Uncharacterized protein n=1 Tax=Tritrichomonas foetus TaxID=1144522 RepID=A0A1J4KFR4_9EUKA|nr:hypothetical protein TRFO_22989 [Tritrichomonas foetus]|eukprot:OHT08478.1 hypothetical protein TRFO_22989 [Tritrichomonas foetus]
MNDEMIQQETNTQSQTPLSFLTQINDPETKLIWKLMAELNLHDIFLIYSQKTNTSQKHKALKRLESEFNQLLEESEELGFEEIEFQDEDKIEEMNESEETYDLQWVSLVFNFSPFTMIQFPFQSNTDQGENEERHFSPEYQHAFEICQKIYHSFMTYNISSDDWNLFVFIGVQFIDKILMKNNSRLFNINDSICSLAIEFTIPIAEAFANTASVIIDDIYISETKYQSFRKLSFPVDLGQLMKGIFHNVESTPSISLRNTICIDALDSWTIGIHDMS